MGGGGLAGGGGCSSRTGGLHGQGRTDRERCAHGYTRVLEKDGSYEVFLDQDSKAQGNIVDGWAFPDKEIKDPDVSKPEDWVDTKKIPDPEAVKPDGYDDIPAEIPDPEAEQPDGFWLLRDIEAANKNKR